MRSAAGVASREPGGRERRPRKNGQRVTQSPVGCPSSAAHFNGFGQLVALVGSHERTQNELVVKGWHTTGGKPAGDVPQSAVVVQVWVHAYPSMAPPPNVNSWQTSGVPGHVLEADAQDTA
jgi:hypothetical protein